MRVAVLTCCRDRLSYTQHCFGRLRELAGTPFDHYVFDQGSTDGTAEWLDQEYGEERLRGVIWQPENVGIHRGLNILLNQLPAGYDVIVKIDNDCELVTPGTLAACAQASLDLDALVSPRIDGLRNPVSPYGHDGPLALTGMIGGIFLAAPETVYGRDGYQHKESNPVGAEDDSTLCGWFRGRGGRVGYLDGYVANHYRTTDGQHEDFPDYFARKYAEASAAC